MKHPFATHFKDKGVFFMVLTKKAGRLIILYSLAALAVMGVFLYRANRERDGLQRTLAVGYDHAFSELTAAVSSLDTSLQKTLCAASPSMVNAVCAEGYAHCAAASQAISSLPYGNIELEHTAAFLAKTGDYLNYLSRMAARGESLTQEERAALETMSKSASQVSGALSELSARLIAGEISSSELERAEDQIAQAEDSLVSTGFAAGFQNMETELPELPALIYDGPFSQHMESARPKTLEGLEEIGEEQALKSAADFLGAGAGELNILYLREDDMPVYVLTRQHGNEVQTVEVTKTGGRVSYFGTVREAAEGSVSPQAAVNKALEFLAAHGYENMTPTYYSAEGGELVANFACEQDGVLCYPDLVKVTVALDTGEVCGLEAGGYTACHYTRELPVPTVDPAEAALKLSPALTVEGTRLALIPTPGKNELLCHEFKCSTPDGRHALVYVNAQTGEEEKILLLLESDSGTLTV